MEYEEDMDESEKMKKKRRRRITWNRNGRRIRRGRNGSKWMKVWRRKISERRSD
jgi:hypothetical protein